jgi:alpha-mannosidase
MKLPFIQKMASRQKSARLPYKLESDLLLVEAGRDGSLQVTHKITGKTWQGLNAFKDGGDCGDEYNFCPPIVDKLIQPRLRQVTIDNGAVRKTMSLAFEMETPIALSSDRKSRSGKLVKSTITSRVTLINGSPRLEIQTTIDNHACDHRLRVHFPTQLVVDVAEHDGHFEVVDRKVGTPPFDDTWVEHPRPEVPQRAFSSVTNGKERLTVANRGLPEVEVEKLPDGGTGIALTLLRCVGWLSRDDFTNRKGHAGPHLETPGAQMQGRWVFDYAIMFDQDTVASRCQAYAFQTPLKTLITGIHSGSLQSTGSFITISTPEFCLSAVKKTEDGIGWLARGYNLSPLDLQVSMKILFPFKKVALGNLAEDKKKSLRLDNNGEVSFTARGHEIVTLLIQ